MSQAQKIGLERFEAIQAQTSLINLMESKGEKAVIEALKKLKVTNQQRSQILEEASQYVKFELEAKKALLMDPVLKCRNQSTWELISSEFSEYIKYHNRQLTKLGRIHNAVK